VKEIAIHAEGLSKQYHIGRARQANATLQERLARASLAPWRRIKGLLQGRAAAAADLDETFWALRDVSFTIRQGEVVGIIGANGSGKSTLLKILSRITEPTEGEASVRGRTGSLLEVGTGFHSELTGRENVFLNGSILGMRQAEIRSKFDEIVAFSEVEKFIDTPVKHYSSGMRVRLAFAVAAHVDPDVLIVDEVLAVGDARFRKKCLDRMSTVARSGTTVLFVSHMAQTITSLCSRAIWLSGGKVVKDGPALETIGEYLGQGLGLSAERKWPTEMAPGGEVARLTAVRIRTEDGTVTDCIDVRSRFCIELEIDVLQEGRGIIVLNGVQNGDGTQVFSAVDTHNPVLSKRNWEKGKHIVRMWIPGNLLQVDTYTVETFIAQWEPTQIDQCYERNLLCFHIIDSFERDSSRGSWTGTLPGIVRPLLEWETIREDADTIREIPRRANDAR
jgi:lipopolysaccharide transport system ATP-binding protein